MIAFLTSKIGKWLAAAGGVVLLLFGAIFIGLFGIVGTYMGVTNVAAQFKK